MRLGEPYFPPGFEQCQPPPPDAERLAGPDDMGGGWSQTLFVDRKTGVHYLEFFNEGSDEWQWVCGIPGKETSAADLIELTEGSWASGKNRMFMWAGLGALAGVVGGMVVATHYRGDRLMYGALGAGAGAAAGALILTLAVRPSQYAQTTGLGLIDVQQRMR